MPNNKKTQSSAAFAFRQTLHRTVFFGDKSGFSASDMLANGLKRDVADDMFDPTGIGGGGFFRNTQVNEHISEHRMSFIDL